MSILITFVFMLMMVNLICLIGTGFTANLEIREIKEFENGPFLLKNQGIIRDFSLNINFQFFTSSSSLILCHVNQ